MDHSMKKKRAAKLALMPTGASMAMPVWLKPLMVPLGLSAALHVAVLVTFITIQAMPGPDGRIAAHNTDDVSTSIELAQSIPPQAPPEAAKPPEPEPVSAPEPAPVEEHPIEVSHEVPLLETPMIKVAPPAPPEPIVAPKAEPVPAAPSRSEQPAATPRTSELAAGFAGVHVRQARRIVYAVDVSGAMAACLDSVLLELRRSIGRLEADQQFQIVFFRQELNGEQRAVAIDDQSGRATMLNANVDTKRRVDQLLRSARPLGRSAPLAGLKRSLELAPDVVFLLTSNIRRSDQGSSSDAGVLRSLEEMNPRSRVSGKRPVVIKTLQFVEDDPTGLMQSIAEAHGDGPGSYVLLRVADIERAER